MIVNGVLRNESSMTELGALLAKHIKAGDVIFLHGQLGAGKTTLTRGLLQSLGYSGVVSSPTYAMVEEYSLSQYDLYHFDGYRIHDEEEWLQMGIEDYLHESAVCIVEWPESGMAILPKPTLSITIVVMPDNNMRGIAIESSTGGQDRLLVTVEEFFKCQY
jgi:tRNA threonylcarbamoyladenosine biosynthesis protein TsaE